jgi:predicted kinase
MKQFKEFLVEKLVTFGGKAYPKFGNVVILQGGAGSGKGFIKNKLLGIDGWSFDVDELKDFILHSEIFHKRIKDDMGIDVKTLDLKNPDDVALLHSITKKYKLDSKFKKTEYQTISMAHPDRKPNLIFDITAKDIKSIAKISDAVTKLGYDKKNIHIVWVLDAVEMAVQKNKNRDRHVPEDILIQTHEFASLTAKKLMSMGNDIKKYMDGDYWIVFNKVGVDSTLVKSNKGGDYIKEAFYVKIKEQGKAPMNPKKFTKQLLMKIRDYVPDIDVW